MKTKLYAILTVFVLLAAATACGGTPLKLTAADSGSQIEVQAGDTFVIELEGNPTTGYTWETLDLQGSLFEQVGETEFSSGNSGLVGAGGMQTLTFRAVQAGSATLTLVYHRPWETDVEPIGTFSVDVVVK
jgi:inhibitor of cysteine peptidase